MKKRILSLFLTAFIVFGSMPFVSADYKAESTRAEGAENFVQTLVGDITVAKEDVSRAEFVGAMAKVFKLDTAEDFVQIYSDVPSSNNYAIYIQQAYKLGWISASGSGFRPNNTITYPEAVKIAVVAMGYEHIAQSKGGYPAGYLAVAGNIGILDGLSMTEDIELSKDELMIFIENMLNAKINKVIGTGIMTTYSTDETLMERYYDVHKVSGIINATEHSSLTSDTKEFSRQMISIDGKNFCTDIYGDDYLGYKVVAYWQYDEEQDVNKIIYIRPYDNSIYEYTTDEYSEFSNGKIKFEDEETLKESKYKLALSYSFVYNGKKFSDKGDLANKLQNANGYIRLLDNNGDDLIDVLFLDDYKYIVVSETDVKTEYIADVNSVKNALKLEDVTYTIKDFETQELIDFESINTGAVVAVAMSADGSFAKLLVCNGFIDKSPTSYGSDGVFFGDELYEVSDYYNLYYNKKFNSNCGGVYYTGINGDIVAYSGLENIMRYGYVLDTDKDTTGFDAESKIKLINDSGAVYIYKLSKRIMVDGSWKDSKDYNEIFSLEETLIKFGLSNGEIKYIDTAMDLTTFEQLYPVEKPSVYNSMTKSTMSVSAKYFTGSGAYVLQPTDGSKAYFMNKANVFMISAEDPEEKSYVGTYDCLVQNQNYTATEIELYDVNEVGMTGAVICHKTPNAYAQRVANMWVVNSVSRVLDSEGEECYKITLMTKEGFLKTYYMDYDMMPSRQVGFGDIVKIKTDYSDERIIAMYSVFDGTQFKALDDEIFDTTLFASYGMRKGVVYEYMDNMVSYADIGYKSGNFNYDNIKFNSVDTTNIVHIDRETKKIRKGYQDDFKSYRDFGADASYIVILGSYGYCSGVFVYEN